jgi:hypothetical protein
MRGFDAIVIFLCIMQNSCGLFLTVMSSSSPEETYEIFGQYCRAKVNDGDFVTFARLNGVCRSPEIGIFETTFKDKEIPGIATCTAYPRDGEFHESKGNGSSCNLDLGDKTYAITVEGAVLKATDAQGVTVEGPCIDIPREKRYEFCPNNLEQHVSMLRSFGPNDTSVAFKDLYCQTTRPWDLQFSFFTFAGRERFNRSFTWGATPDEVTVGEVNTITCDLSIIVNGNSYLLYKKGSDHNCVIDDQKGNIYEVNIDRNQATAKFTKNGDEVAQMECSPWTDEARVIDGYNEIIQQEKPLQSSYYYTGDPSDPLACIELHIFPLVENAPPAELEELNQFINENRRQDPALMDADKLCPYDAAEGVYFSHKYTTSYLAILKSNKRVYLLGYDIWSPHIDKKTSPAQ